MSDEKQPKKAVERFHGRLVKKAVVKKAEEASRPLLEEGTEETTQILEDWGKRAREQTLETLPAFLLELTERYQHDYGTIVHACTLAAVAAARAVDRSPQGGITGFQHGAVMWRFLKEWMEESGPMQLVRYESLLSPHGTERLLKREITRDTFEWLQEEARKRLPGSGRGSAEQRHLERIVAGEPPEGFAIVGKY